MSTRIRGVVDGDAMARNVLGYEHGIDDDITVVYGEKTNKMGQLDIMGKVVEIRKNTPRRKSTC